MRPIHGGPNPAGTAADFRSIFRQNLALRSCHQREVRAPQAARKASSRWTLLVSTQDARSSAHLEPFGRPLQSHRIRGRLISSSRTSFLFVRASIFSIGVKYFAVLLVWFILLSWTKFRLAPSALLKSAQKTRLVLGAYDYRACTILFVELACKPAPAAQLKKRDRCLRTSDPAPRSPLATRPSRTW
jgi:hypothetical protein